MMARPIEPTPTLYGEDASRVLDEIENSQYSETKEKFLKECKETRKLTEREKE